MYRNLVGILSVFAAALVVVGITFSASTDRPAHLRFVNGTEPKSLDPHIMTGQPEGRIADALFEGLMVRDPRSLRPVPGAATDFPAISADRKTYTFHVRPEARWSDGRTLDARDFAYSWRRLQDPRIASEYAYIHHMIEGAEEYNTYGGNADTIRDTLRPGLERLRGEHPQGLGADAWQTFLAEARAAEALKNVTDPVLVDALTRRQGTLSPGDLEAVALALEREEGARRDAFAYWEAHYGLDDGVYVPEGETHTLVVELKAPTPYFLDVVAFYSSHPVPRHVVEVQDDEGRFVNSQDWFMPDKIVSNGPWRMAGWRVNEKIRLVESPTYWNAEALFRGDRPRPAIVDAYPIENATTSLNLYLTGAVDWLPGNYPADLVDQLKDRPDFYRNPGLVVYYYRFNTTRPPLDDPRVRQAFCMAIDRRLIVDKVLRLGQLPAYHLVPPGLAGYERPESHIRFDPAEARRLLAEAGYPGGRGFPNDVTVLFNTSEAHKKIAEVVADHLKRNLGIEIDSFNQEWQAYQATMLKLDYWMARAGWIGDYLDPNTFLDMWVTNGGNNQTGWGDPLYDRLVRVAANVEALLEGAEARDLLPRLKEEEEARRLLEALRAASTDEERVAAGARLRMHLFREAEAILTQDAFPICPVYFYVVSGLVKPYVKGFYSRLEFPDGSTGDNLQDIHPLRGMWVER